jgi:rare lipoprotein A (peptidoglycan hydrolase)
MANWRDIAACASVRIVSFFVTNAARAALEFSALSSSTAAWSTKPFFASSAIDFRAGSACLPARHTTTSKMVRSLVLLVVTVFAVGFFTGCASTSPTYASGETLHGMASWYGAEQGRETSSGERFNPHLLTAAHRHLPFGSIVRVTNEQNGCSVDVRINDRGPWTGNDRIIDVSSAAADILQMKQAGVVPVDVEVISLGRRAPRALSVTVQ